MHRPPLRTTRPRESRNSLSTPDHQTTEGALLLLQANSLYISLLSIYVYTCISIVASRSKRNPPSTEDRRPNTNNNSHSHNPVKANTVAVAAVVATTVKVTLITTTITTTTAVAIAMAMAIAVTRIKAGPATAIRITKAAAAVRVATHKAIPNAHNALIIITPPIEVTVAHTLAAETTITAIRVPRCRSRSSRATNPLYPLTTRCDKGIELNGIEMENYLRSSKIQTQTLLIIIIFVIIVLCH